MIICLDAGHYGKYNRSPGVAAYYESDMAWKLHLLLKKHLEGYGIQVKTTRPAQAGDLALESRGKAAAGCDLFISVHSNAVGSYMNESIDHPLAVLDVTGKADAIGLKLAQTVAQVMGTKEPARTLKKYIEGTNLNWYGVLRGAAAVGVPGVLLEHSFHTNTAATNWLLNDSNLDKLAKAEAEIIAAHYGVSKPSEKPTDGLQAVCLKDMSPADIIAKMGGVFSADMANTGVLASVSMAQFILESGWGKSELAQNANNCFGMKKTLSGNTWAGSVWDGVSVYTKETQEYINGQYVAVKADFRKYSCVEQSIADHSAYLNGAKDGEKLRYSGLKGEKDYKKAVQIIKDGDYATSPDYVEKLCGIIEQYGLTKYDDVATQQPENKVLHRVQVGAFGIKSNAQAMVDKVTKAGFDAIIVQSDGYYKVQAGAFSVKDNAVRQLDKLRKAGFSAFITTVGGDKETAEEPLKSIEEIAREVIAGKWGNGADRKRRLNAAGYDYNTVQTAVNAMLK